MKKHIVSVCLIFAYLNCSAALCFGEDYQPPPLFLAGEVPPLLMLVMGKDHKLYYEAYNDASDLNGDGVLDIRFNPTIDYYGYFDCYKCYSYDTTGKVFKPSSVTATKKCDNTKWSGNFLNYVTMSRMDTMRKVLYGGSRSTDTATETVLQRVYIPQDAHSWGKQYTSNASVAAGGDGYDIREYTPLALPHTGLRHLFASTTLISDSSPPLLRVLNDSIYKIWEWVSIERPVAGAKCLNGGSGPDCAQPAGDLWEVVPAANFTVAGSSTLRQEFYSTRKCCSFPSSKSLCCTLKSGSTTKCTSGSTPCYSETAPVHPADHAAYETFVATYATAARKFCATPQTPGNIDGTTNACGYGEYYLNVIKGTLVIDTERDYTFAIDGDDAVEVIIDGTPVVGFYGDHAACGTTAAPCYTYSGMIHLAVGQHTIEYRHENNAGADRYVLYWKKDVVNSVITDYEVRVKVCDPSVGLESSCATYTDNSGVKHYKPTGILQRHGELDRMYFGLITGTYINNLQGGVVRKEIKSIKNEINLETGQFSTVDGIIKTIDKFKIRNFDYGSYSYTDCFGVGGASSLTGNNGKCRNWGNPIGEMMYETLRYYAGKKTPTGIYTYSTSTDDDALGLPKVTAWEDPYKANTATGWKGYSYCSKPFMLVLSDINPSYDSDQVPGSSFATYTGDLTGLNAKTLANYISTQETSKPVNYFIGDQIGQTYIGACTEKTNGGLGDIRGLCPEEPTKQGSYYAASVAYFGRKNDISATASSQKVMTYAVAMSSPLPKLEIPVGNYIITLVPFAKSVGGGSINAARGQYQPTNAIVDFYITTLLPTHGEFQINYEDVEQGSDHDMDAICKYVYQVVDASGNDVSNPALGKAVKITLSSDYAAGGIIQHMGYIISGTTKDGTYLEVRDKDTAAASDPDYFLDTPPTCYPNTGVGDVCWDDNGALPLSSVRTFTPDTSGGSMVASLLKDPLWYAAKWGGFNDINENGRPDTQLEWDADNDTVPDTYFFVTNPLKLEEQLNKSFADILKKAGSGTAVSVLATKGEGEGTIVQAYFKPKVTDNIGVHTVSWAGFMQALWVDPYGNLREDTLNDRAFNPATDKIIEFFQDTTGDTKVRRYEIPSADSYAKTGGSSTIFMEDIVPLWEAGKKLWQRSAPDRTIYTSLDGSALIDFKDTNVTAIKPYLGVTDAAAVFLGVDLTNRAKNLINFTRGMSDTSTDPDYAYIGETAIRQRTFEIDGIKKIWKLSDIVYSTPVIVSRPVENYNLVYDDATYKEFYDTYKDRETVAYVGANDGMLHAFSFGIYDDNATKKKFNTGPTVGIGEELWAYVPRCQLPHLRMLANLTYSGSNHLSFVDLKPRIFDAQVFSESTTHPGGWGTILIAGMNMGGSRIQVTDAALPGGTQTFYSSYAAFDVTEASKTPTLLWEKDFGGILGYTTSAPCVFKVKDKWFLAIGSGPTAYDAVSTQKGRVIIVDIATGALLRTFETDETAAFMNTPVALDKNLNFSVAAIYAGSTYRVGTGPWQGRAYKIAIPQLNGSGVYSPSCKDCYDDNPANWVWTKILDMPAPFTAPFALTIDQKDNVWIFMGSGRFLASDDKTSGTQNYIMGMKDPFYNRRGIAESKTTGLPACYNKYDVTCPLTAADLFNATPYAIKADGTVDVKAGFTETLGLDGKTFDDMMTLGVKKKGTGTDPLEIYQGWYRELLVPPASCPCICVDLACDVDQSCMTNPACPSPCNRESCTASERNLNKPVAFGGLALFPTFTPIADPCMSGGTSNLYGLYFESGTAYKKAAFLQADNTAVIQDVIGLGFGLASAPAIHAAKEAGQSGTAYMQMSTGQIVEIPIDPIFNIKSGIQFWREGR